MVAGTRSTNTFQEGLAKILGDLSQMKIEPDADLNFIMQMETMILQKLRGPSDQLAAVQAQQGGGGGMPSPGALPSGGDQTAGLPPDLLAALTQGGGPGGPPGAGPGGPPGMSPGMPMPGGGGPPMPMPANLPPGLRNAGPSPDEMRRLLSH